VNAATELHSQSQAAGGVTGVSLAQVLRAYPDDRAQASERIPSVLVQERRFGI